MSENEDNSESLSKILGGGSEAYSEQASARALVAGIPYIGSSIDAFISAKGQAITRRRLEDFINLLVLEFKVLKRSAIDSEYLNSEEFFDLLMKSFDAAIKTRHEQKRKIYARLLKSAIVNKDREKYSVEESLSALTELSVAEVAILKEIYEMQRERPSVKPEFNELQWVRSKGWDSLQNRLDGISLDNLTFYLARMTKSGFIREITGTYTDYLGGAYIVSNKFRSLIEFVEEFPD